MQLRVLARRSLGSMTIVGDVAQASGHWAPSSWDQVLAHLPSVGGPARSGRTHRQLPHAGGDHGRRRCGARRGRARAAHAALGPTGRSAAAGRHDRRRRRRDRRRRRGEEERRAARWPSCARRPTSGACRRHSATPASTSAGTKRGWTQPIALVPVVLAKGLEFDSVIVVEPNGDRRRREVRPALPVRRAHPRHQAGHDRALAGVARLGPTWAANANANV